MRSARLQLPRPANEARPAPERRRDRLAAAGRRRRRLYWFTASTSFANPAITIARSLSDTFSGIRPVDVPGFIVAQLVGAFLALLVAPILFSASHLKAVPAPVADASADAEKARPPVSGTHALRAKPRKAQSSSIRG